MQRTMIKICGLADIDNVHSLLSLSPDYMGFIFVPQSPRYVIGRIEPHQLGVIPASVRKVGVFMDTPLEEVLRLASLYNLDALQLHGNESPDMCASLRSMGYEVIKAFAVKKPDDLLSLHSYEGSVDLFLLDAPSPGSGVAFDWRWLGQCTLPRPLILAGGIDETNITEAHATGADMLDLNSRFESSSGIKDYKKLHNALKQISCIK